MEDSRFAEASRRVYLFLIFWRVWVAGKFILWTGGRVDGWADGWADGWKSKVAKKGSEYCQTDTRTFLLIKKQDFL